MWRNILIQVAYQLLVMIILMFFGQMMFFEKSFNIITTEPRKNGVPTDKLVLNTIIFHTFILMNIMNMINSRVVVDDELNVFKTLFNNKYFWLVFVFEMGVQNAIIWFAELDLISALFGVAPLKWYMVLVCWILALLTLGVRVLA